LATVRELIGDELAERQYSIIRDIGMKEIHRFRIGLDGLQTRPLGEGDSAAAIVTEDDFPQLLDAEGFFRVQMESARGAGADTGLLFLGSAGACAEAREHVGRWNPELCAVYLELPETDLLLNPAQRLGAKMMLNALSTCTMVRLGRVMGNVMIWVVQADRPLQPLHQPACRGAL